MKLHHFFTLLAVAVFGTATAADAAVQTVKPGGSIQEAINAASPGDTILVEPGTYREVANADFGLRISTDNLRLIGKVKPGQGDAGKVRLVRYGTQQTGVYAAPAACGPGVPVGGCANQLQGFYIRGFSVEDFPRNGIQTRFVKDFEMIRNESIRNLENGIYPTISANGLIENNVSYGSLDTALWVAASENVRVIGNNLYGSPIGFEITVSNNVTATHNDVHNNTIGFGLFHPNAAGNAQLPVMANWVIEHNNIYDNNLPNPAPPGSFQAGVPPGVGILLLGVSNNVIAKNDIENNDFAGIAVLGWCTATSLGDPSRNCENDPPQADPSANNNLVSLNTLTNNGLKPPPIPVPPVDILYIQFEPASGNCFEKNKPSGFTFFSTEPDGELPSDGC
jgi:parallel beta-helix repeat protein